MSGTIDRSNLKQKLQAFLIQSPKIKLTLIDGVPGEMKMRWMRLNGQSV